VLTLLAKFTILFVWDRLIPENLALHQVFPHIFFAEPWQEVFMIDPDSEKFPAKLQYRIFTSPAFLDLKPASKMILILMYYEIKFKKFGSKKKWLPLNEDNIVLPYKEIRHRIKYTDKTIWTSIQDLMAHGFINIRSYGGRAKGDFTIYMIKADWQNWEVGSVVYQSRTSKRVGFQTGGRGG